MDQIQTYTIKANFRAPALKPDPRGFSNWRQFMAGQKVKGFIPTNSNVPELKIIVTTDGFLVPERVIVEPLVLAVDKASKGTTLPDGTQAKKPVILPKELQDRLNAIKSTDIVKNIVNTSRTSINGLMAGATIGALISLITGKPFFVSVILGGLGGGLVGYGLSRHKDADVLNKPVHMMSDEEKSQLKTGPIEL